MNFFGKPKPKATQPKDAIIKLRDMLTVLDKKEKHLQSKIDQELRIAKENATKNKRGKSGSGPRGLSFLLHSCSWRSTSAYFIFPFFHTSGFDGAQEETAV